MIKIVQFGQGNFLRTFVDVYFDTLNKEGFGPYSVDIVKPIPFGNLDNFVKQNYKYHIVLRGSENNHTIEKPFFIEVVNSTFSPFVNFPKFLSLAGDKDLKIIVSNTTEAGITYSSSDKITDFTNMTFPGKLTLFLFERFQKGLPGVYLLPVELIDNNASELKKCVDLYINLWNLGPSFKKWNDEENYYCATLVDRIVSGFPKDEITKKHLFSLINKEDNLLSIGEPFGLWVIEDKGNIKDYIIPGKHNINVLLTDDISYYKKRKVRILNGSHTNLVPIGLFYGKETVYDVMRDEILFKFVNDTLNENIIPFVSDDINKTKEFALSVNDRFLNPFLNHQLTSIALNSISKWKARDLCSFIDYFEKNQSLPKYLTIGFAYLIALYMRIYKKDNLYYAKIKDKEIEMKDEEKYLTYFPNHSIHDFLQDSSIWGMDLTKFPHLEDKINEYVSKINKGEKIL